MKVFTIGFTKKSAEDFFTRLSNAGVKRVVDVRLNNVSQLAGFAKAHDLKYFLRQVGGIDYAHIPEFAPTQDILDQFKKNKGSWETYRRKFNKLISERNMEQVFFDKIKDGDCLLCSEDTHEQCHRGILADHFKKYEPNLEVKNL